MLNSIKKILLKVQVFTLSQLNGSCQATWNRILLLGHVKLKHRSTLQLHDAVCNFLSTALAYLQRFIFPAMGAQHYFVNVVLSIFLFLRLYLLTFCHHVIATGTGRWHPRL